MLELLKYDFFQNALISMLLIGISCNDCDNGMDQTFSGT